MDSGPGSSSEGAPARESVLQRRLTLAEMLDVPSFTEVVKSFVDLYQIGVKLFDEKGAKLVDLKIGSGDFCAYAFSFSRGRTQCTATVGRAKDGPIAPLDGARAPQLAGGAGPKGMVTVPCFTGLRYLVAPVLWDGDTLGRVVFGPFVPDDEPGLAPGLAGLAPDFDVAKARALMSKIRRAPEATAARVLAHFMSLLETLVAAGQKTYLTTQMHVEASLETNRELERQNAQLRGLNERLKEFDRLKSSFLATVSHELRTPLTSIIGYSEMLSEGIAGELNQEQRDYVRTIQEKGETLLKLISSILDLSQIEAGKVRLVFESLNVADVVNTAVTSVKPQAQKKGVTLNVRLPLTGPVTARADAERLRQVVVNLLANGVKFTANGGRVSVLLSERGHQPELDADGYRITVEDTGVGIPADQFDRIFDSFYQVDSSSTREFGGAGLGLAIVKSFVEGHGGVVRVSSEAPQGARFTAILPTTPAQTKTTQILPPVALETSGADRF